MNRKLIDANNQFYSLKPKISFIKSKWEIKTLSKKIEDCDEKLDVNRDYYNTNISEYNKLIKLFPTNIVAKLCKYEEKLYFDRKDMSDDDFNDFKF